MKREFIDTLFCVLFAVVLMVGIGGGIFSIFSGVDHEKRLTAIESRLSAIEAQE